MRIDKLTIYKGSVEDHSALPCSHPLYYSSQSHLLTLVCYPSRSSCHPLLLHAVCGPGPVPQVPESALPGMVPLPDHCKVLLKLKYIPSCYRIHNCGGYSFLYRWFGLRIDILNGMFISLVTFSSVPLAACELITSTSFSSHPPANCMCMYWSITV